MLLAVVRGGFTLAGVGMFLAGLYVGLGALGIEEARLVSNGIFGGSLGRDVDSNDGMGLGPAGRRGIGISLNPGDCGPLNSEADGILTMETAAGSCSPSVREEMLAFGRSAANRSSTFLIAFPCIPSGFGRTGGLCFGDGGTNEAGWAVPPEDGGLPSLDGISEARLWGLEEGEGRKPLRRSINGVGGDGSTEFLAFSFMMISLMFRN
jgi:hypothetical protein